MNSPRTNLAIASAIGILIVAALLPASDWSQSEHLWTVPIRLGLESAAPFIVAAIVATFVAGRRITLPLITVWSLYWLFGIFFLGSIDLIANPPTYWQLVAWNTPGIVLSFIAILVGSLSAYEILRRYRDDSQNAA